MVLCWLTSEYRITLSILNINERIIETYINKDTKSYCINISHNKQTNENYLLENTSGHNSVYLRTSSYILA